MQGIRPPPDPAATRPPPPQQPQPPSSWTARLALALSRSWRSVTESQSSSTTTTTTTTPTPTRRLGERPVQAGLPANAAARALDGKQARREALPRLADLWPGHAWRDAPVQALCEDLVKQNGAWQKAAVFKALQAFSEAQAQEFGEFAAYLQAHPCLRDAPVISQWLAELSVPAFSRADRHPRDPHGLRLVGGLVNGLARGLMRTDQTYSLVEVLKRMADAQRLRCFDGLAGTVVELQGHVSDLGLQEVLAAIHDLQLPHEHGLLRQCRQLAQSDAVAVTALHRLVRLATRHPYKSQVPCQDWYADWLRLLAAPPRGEGAITPARQFAIGHAAATACVDYTPSRPSLQAVLDGKHAEPPGPPGLPPPQYAPPQPTPAARAGVLWALDPMASLAALPRDPEAALHLGAWLDLEEPARRFGLVRLYQQVEALDLPFDRRYQLQRLVLRREGAFAAVRASLLEPHTLVAAAQGEGHDDRPPAGGQAADALAQTLSRLTDLYRYFGEREGLAFAFGPDPDLARIRAQDAHVRARIAAIEDAMRELLALAPPASPTQSAQAAFMREGYEALAQVTLGASLKALQAAHARATGTRGGSGIERKALDDGLAQSPNSLAKSNQPDAAPPPETKAGRAPALADIWPGHVFRPGPATSLCTALLKQRGHWDEKDIAQRLAKLDGAGLQEAGEFAARLQAYPSLRQGRLLMQVLVELALPGPPGPVDDKQDALRQSKSVRLGHLAQGITAGLIRSGQHLGLQQLLARLRDGPCYRAYEGLGQAVLTLGEHMPDARLADAMMELVRLPLMVTDSLPQQLRRLALADGAAPQGLHRLARIITSAYIQHGEHRLGEWLAILEPAHDGQEPLPPDRLFAIGHGIGRACRDAERFVWARQVLEDARHFLDGKHRPSRATSRLSADLHARGPRPQPMAAARAGARWGEDPLRGLASLPGDPDRARHLEAWIALEEPLRHIEPVAWYRTVEGMGLPFAERHRLQRLVLARGENFATVRASMLPAAGVPAPVAASEGLDDAAEAAGGPMDKETDGERAATLARLSDLYRYYGEREGLEFAFGDAPDLARIRQEEARVRERITRIEQAMRELPDLGPGADVHDTPAQAFLREGLAQVAQVTLGPSLAVLRANLAQALRESAPPLAPAHPAQHPGAGPPADGPAARRKPDGKGDADGE